MTQFASYLDFREQLLSPQPDWSQLHLPEGLRECLLSEGTKKLKELYSQGEFEEFLSFLQPYHLDYNQYRYVYMDSVEDFRKAKVKFYGVEEDIKTYVQNHYPDVAVKLFKKVSFTRSSESKNITKYSSWNAKLIGPMTLINEISKVYICGNYKYYDV